MTTYSAYLFEQAGTTSISDLIEGTNIAHSTMSRYLSGERKIPIQAVAAMSQKYDLPLLDNMVAAGFITEHQARRERRRYNLTEMSDQDLAAEFLRRMEAATSSQLAQQMDEPLRLSDYRPTLNERQDAAKPMTEDVPEE